MSNQKHYTIIDFINKAVPRSIELETAFSQIKKKQWETSLILLAEINVQLGQLLGIIKNDESVLEQGRNFDNVADELCDILLNLSYLMKLEDITVELSDPVVGSDIANLEMLPILHGQLSEAVLEEEQYRFFKLHDNKTTKEFIKERMLLMYTIIFNYAAQNNIDLNAEFDRMCENALNFVNQKNKGKTLEKVLIGAPYGTSGNL